MERRGKLPSFAMKTLYSPHKHCWLVTLVVALEWIDTIENY